MSNDRRYLIQLNRSMETGEPSVVDTPEFHDEDLLRQAWKISPYNKFRHTHKRPKNIQEEIIRNAMSFQPVSGYCGLATVNTVLRSLPTPLFVPYPDRGRGYSIFSLAEYLILHCAPDPFLDVEAIFMEKDTTLDQFRGILKRYANAADYRLMANFHRTPLFYSTGSTDSEAAWRVYAGHWSPVGGIIEREGKEYALVLDTNEKYGPFMVSLERFYRAVKTQTLNDGYRGFIKVRIK